MSKDEIYLLMYACRTSNITFDGGDSKYKNSKAARNILETTYKWKISDGGLEK